MRLTATGVGMIGVTYVSAFVNSPPSPRLLQQPQARATLLRPRTVVDLANIDGTAVSTPTPRNNLLLHGGGRHFESFRYRKRPWSAAWTTNSKSFFMASASLQQTTSTRSHLDLRNETERGILGQLRLVIIGANASELGLKLAEFYGAPVKSMEDLMKGKRGRRTDLVKAKVASQWLELEGGAGKCNTRLLYIHD